MAEKLNIKEWNEEDRPREKLSRLGAGALTDAELLAILIGSGSAKETSVALMQRVLNDCNNNLNTLGKFSKEDLCRYNGIGEAKAITIMAAVELGKRRQREKLEERRDMGSAQAIYELIHSKVQDSDVEEAWIVLMNRNYKLIDYKCVSHGGITETAVDVRIIIKEALLKNATVVALCHNHPSNNPRPSRDDDRLTEKVKNACDTMRILFLDHIIVTDGAYFSYSESGRL